jgi:hypothetical protein
MQFGSAFAEKRLNPPGRATLESDRQANLFKKVEKSNSVTEGYCEK